jgi:beta-glucosidase
MVLLKNEKNTLPFSPDWKSLAVIGPLGTATVDLLGNWHGAGDGGKVVPVLEAIKQRMGRHARVLFAPGCGVSGTDRSGFKRALDAARRAQAVVMVLGESEIMSGEAASRSGIDLPGIQMELVEEIARLGKPLAVVLLNGRPLTLERLHRCAPAILEAWFPGTMGGKAITAVLFGDAAPTGRLTMTFPRNVGQIPLYYGMKNTGRPMDPNNKYTSKYLDVPNTPLYPFGYGLTYTTFRYGPPELSAETLSVSGEISVRVRLANDGKRPGEELVQLYVRDLNGSVTRPVRELKGFQRISLHPGEDRQVSFRLRPRDLAFLRADGTFGPEPGRFEVFIGGNAQDAISAGCFSLK